MYLSLVSYLPEFSVHSLVTVLRVYVRLWRVCMLVYSKCVHLLFTLDKTNHFIYLY